MNIIEHFERRKRWCEEELRVAEAAPSVRLFRRSAAGGEIDLTEKHKKDLRDACDVYQHAIDLLKSKPIRPELPTRPRPQGIPKNPH
jgi:hypothetical protein